MQVSTTPLRWNEIRNNPKERERRVDKTTVTLIEYPSEGKPNVDFIDSPTRLKQVVDTLHNPSNQTPLKLFIVEDLSRPVIELLGARFDVDPFFFRDQIDDYIWHNTRDPWAVPPSLSSNLRRRKWFRLRNVRFRYHDSDEDFDASRLDAYLWNVLRRPDNDGNHWSYGDKDGAVVSMLRTRSAIWIGEDSRCGNSTVGIVLLDPTVHHGQPLWYDRTNWLPVPGMSDQKTPDVKVSESWYADIVQMTRSYPWFNSAEKPDIDTQVIAMPTLYAVCAEWLVVCDYVKTRLSQVERELELPEVFRSRGDVIDESRKRLHNWRGVLHVFIEMVSEALLFELPTAERLTTPQANAGVIQYSPTVGPSDAFEDISSDFKRVLEMLHGLQQRVDRLTGVVTSEISIEESRRALREAHNMARLTWLASIFIPMTFVTGLFSMTESVAGLSQTFWIYFAIAVPFTGLVIRLGMFRWRKVADWFVSTERGLIDGKKRV